jgi:membrane associated rhomboid family serine protease
MSYQQMERKGKIRFGEDGNALLSLIFVIVTAFLILIFIKIVYQLSGDQATFQEKFNAGIYSWTVLPANLSTFITRPWTIVTHMISHFDVWGMIGNMIFLWSFGYLLQDLTGNKHIVPLFVYGCLAGALLFMISANVLPKFAAQINSFQYTGASAGILAIAIAATVTAPDYRLFPMINGGIPLWVLTLIFVVIDLTGHANKGFPEMLAHVGGGLTGFLYVKQMQKGNNPGSWMHRFYFWFVHLFDPKQKPEKPSLKQEVFYNTKGKQPFTKSPSITQQRVDAILDKINQKGYNSLTQEEKDILKKAGEDETL